MWLNQNPAWLEQLDPARAPEVTGWGLGNAWYAIFAAIGVIVLLLLIIAYAHWLTGAYRRKALAELKKIEGPASAEQLQQLSLLLRRIALRRFEPSKVAGLTGREWLEFLDYGSNRTDFSEGAGQVLANGPYRAQAEYNSQVLFGLCKKWIERNS